MPHNPDMPTLTDDEHEAAKVAARASENEHRVSLGELPLDILPSVLVKVPSSEKPTGLAGRITRVRRHG